MPIFDPRSYQLEIDGLVRKPRTFTYDELLALPQSHQVSTFHCVTGWTVQNVHWSGVRFKHLLDLVEPLPSAEGAPLRLARGALQRLAHARAGRPSRRDARARHGRAAALAPARVAGAGRHPRDVRLQGRQVADEDRARRRPADRLLGRASATTRTPGSATRMATARPSARAAPALQPHRARGALGPRGRLLRPARLRALPLPAEPRRAGRPAAAPEDDPYLHGARLGDRPAPRRRARRPPVASPHGPRGRVLRRRRPLAGCSAATSRRDA